MSIGNINYMENCPMRALMLTPQTTLSLTRTIDEDTDLIDTLSCGWIKVDILYVNPFDMSIGWIRKDTHKHVP